MRLTLLLFLLYSGLLCANQQVRSLLDQIEAPEGIVFEIAEDDDNALDWALPEVIKFSQQLRQKFPGLDIAVVTHGKEEFALQTINQQNDNSVHQYVKNLLSEDIPVHICETHAGWYGVEASDFPDYVDVVPAGPVQIDQYREIGFVVIRIDAPRSE